MQSGDEYSIPAPSSALCAAHPTCLAFCITDLDPGGAERALVQLVTRLDRSCWQPVVFCLSGPGVLAAELEQAEVPVTCLGARSPRHVTVVPRLVRRLREVRPALLQTSLFHANMVGRLAGRLAGVPHVVSGIRVAEKRSRIPLWLDRATEWMVDHHVCVSRDVADFSIARGGLPAEKITVIPNGVDTARFGEAVPADLSEFGIPPGSRTIIFVGRLDRQKGPFVLLESAEGLIEVHRDVHFLLVGDGPLKKPLQTWVAHRRLEDRIHFAGWRPDVPELLKAADCLVLPSLWEGMPNAVLEAMAASLPVVATEVEGTADLVRNHETGLLVPPEAPRELAGGLALMLADPQQSREMGLAAQALVAKMFTWDAVVVSYENLYRALLER